MSISRKLNFSLPAGFRGFLYISLLLMVAGMMKFTFDGLHQLIRYKEFLSQPIIFYTITLIAMIAFFALLLIKRYFFVNLIFCINILFFIFLGSKIIIDTGELDRVRSVLFSTASGVAFYYVFAVLLSCLISAIYHDACTKPKKQKCLILFGFAQNVYYLAHLLYLGFIGVTYMHETQFLVAKLGNAYQQPSSMLSMVFCFTTLLTLLTQAVGKHLQPTMAMRFLQKISFLIYLISGILTFFIMQAINSNKGALLAIAFVYLTIFFNVLISSRTLKSSLFSRLNIISSKRVFLRMVKYFSLTLLLGMAALFISTFNSQPEKFDMRLMHFFQERGSSSLVSRGEILKLHFFDQASYSPIWGDVAVDEKLGVHGSYPHSMLLFSLTHLGIIGVYYLLFSIFLCYYNVFKTSDFHSKHVHFMSNINRLVTVIILLPTLFLGIIGTTMYWSVYWFVLGLVTPSISFTIHNNYASSKAVNI